MNLDNKIIIVTGANRGIGAGIVSELLKHKVAKIFAAARNIKKLPDFGDKRVISLELDITNQSQVDTVVKTAKDVQILINNAGTAQFGTALDIPIDAARGDMETNYFGTLSVVRAFAPVLTKNAPGLIANISSVVGFAAIPVVGTYSASKFALHALTQSLRAELANKNIHVVGVYPGPIDTDMAKDLQMEKTSVADTARAIVAGLIAGDEYIFPDPMSREIGSLWLHDPVALERQFASFSGQVENAV